MRTFPSFRSSRRSSLRRSRGAALLVALLVATLAAAVAVTLVTDEQRWLSGVEARRDHAQAQALADAGVQWARHILYQDGRHGSADHLKESWAFPLPPTPLENGSIEGQIVDLQGRLNLNNLLPESNLKRAATTRLMRLCERQGLDESVRRALVARYAAAGVSLSADSDNTGSGTTGAKLAPLFDVGELDLPAAALARIAADIVALPGPTPLNVNTAGREALRTLFADISDDDLNKLIEERARKPFFSLTEFRQRLPKNAASVDENGLSVSSRYFMITVRARQGDARATAQALLRREDKRWPEIVWKTVE